MISVFVKEQKRYTQDDLVKLFQCSSEKAVKLIRKLKQFGVLKSVKSSDIQKNMTDLLDVDIDVADVEIGDSSHYYIFTFVGVILIGDKLVLKCYPKYIFSKQQPQAEMKQVMSVIAKYNRSIEQVINLNNGDSENTSFNLFSVILFLLKDFYEYGLYSNNEKLVEENGFGGILWERTIDTKLPIFSCGRPYYMNLLTSRAVNNENDYFHRLHKAVLTDCSNKLIETQLFDIFDLEPIQLTDDKISDFGDIDYILNRINGELSVQFNTRKQIILKTIYSYISSEKQVFEKDDNISMFGTNSFNLVWEQVCSTVFKNMLHKKLKELPLSLCENYKNRENSELIDIIQKPEWMITQDLNIVKIHRASDTLRPDLITISGKTFSIFDAKYYNISMNENMLSGQPGIESITKQYLYQLAYKDFIKSHGFEKVINCFLFPIEKDEYIDKGYTELKMLHALDLENIAVKLLPAKHIFDAYLSGKTLDISIPKTLSNFS